MINAVVVRIAAERIMNSGINPRTSKVYVLDDITNPDYRAAVEDYMLTHTERV